MRRELSVALGVGAAVVLTATAAHAHEVGLSSGQYAVDGATISATFEIATADFGDLPSGAAGLVFTADGAPCPGVVDRTEPASDNGTRVLLTYTCPAPPVSLELHVALLAELDPAHRHVLRVTAGTASWDEVAWRTTDRFTFDLSGAPGAAPTSEAPTFGGFFLLGVEHILIGIDHILFLLALILVGVSWRSLVIVITAFTIAHSVTLGLAVLQVYVPPGEVIEPLIALSIAWVGIENFFVKDASKRWRITFPFGLIHGFGFAGALAERGLDMGNAAMSLLAFNLGVEAGQLLIVAPALPLVIWAGKAPWFGRRGIHVVSAGVVIIGLYWFVERTFLG